MSEPPHEQPNAETTEAEGPRRIAAARDPAFVRLSADVSFANVIGGDVDVALLLRQTVYRDIVMGEGEQPSEVKGGKTLVEVGRLRIPMESATFLAFNILNVCAAEDVYALEAFDANVQRIREVILQADSEGTDLDAE